MLSAAAYYERALEKAPTGHRDEVLFLGRFMRRHFGLGAAQTCARFYSPEDVVRAVRNADDPSVGLLCQIAAVLEGGHRAEIEEMVRQSLRRAGAYKTLDELTNVSELTPELLDLAFEQIPQIEGDLGLEGAALVELLAKAGRIADALVVKARIPARYDNVLLRAEVAVATHTPPPANVAHLDKAWQLIFQDRYASRNWNDAPLIASLMPAVVAQPPHIIAALWERAVSVLARMGRRDLFDSAAAMAPMAAAVGGADAVAECWRAARDVSRWWP